MARRRIRQDETVERKIYFFRTNAGRDRGNRPIAFDPVVTLRHIDSLPWTTAGRYWVANDGKVTTCWIDDIESPQRMRLGNIRRTDLPQMEQGGSLRPLLLPGKAGLAESVHMMFFPGNIVGSDFNFYGPRVSRFSYYLAEKAQGVSPVVFFEPLL